VGLEARIPSLSAAECLIIEEVRVSAAAAQNHVETIAALTINIAAGLI
jgi:hypothetical protein